IACGQERKGAGRGGLGKHASRYQRGTSGMLINRVIIGKKMAGQLHERDGASLFEELGCSPDLLVLSENTNQTVAEVGVLRELERRKRGAGEVPVPCCSCSATLAIVERPQLGQCGAKSNPVLCGQTCCSLSSPKCGMELSFRDDD